MFVLTKENYFYYYIHEELYLNLLFLLHGKRKHTSNWNRNQFDTHLTDNDRANRL